MKALLMYFSNRANPFAEVILITISRGVPMKTLLVIDDESHIRHLYHIFFSQEGYQVLEAMNADTANEILNRQTVDLVLLDLRMPGASGSTFYEVMQLFHRKVKVIVSSVYPVEQQKEFVPGALDYFDKSRGLVALLAKVEKILQKA
jgi:DNA-binding NtrC family response regulator